MATDFANLESDNPDLFKAAFRAAVAAGATGEAALVARLRQAEADSWEHTTIIAALGECDGPLGEELLRSIATSTSQGNDDRCAALLALTKRVGEGASETLTQCLSEPNSAVRDYAALCAAVAGGSGAESLMLKRLQASLSGPAPEMPFLLQKHTLSMQSDVLPAVVYLAKYATDKAAVASLIRSSWNNLYTAEQDWLTLAWPATNPNSPATSELPDPRAMTEWLRHPLFDHLYR